MEIASYGNHPQQHLGRAYTAPVNQHHNSRGTFPRPHHAAPARGVPGGGLGGTMSSGSAGGHHSLAHSQAHTNSNHSMQSFHSSRSSDTTQGTSTSTLFPPPTKATNAMATSGGPPANAPGDGDIRPTNNVMNSVADASQSLYQICVSLRARLMGVGEFADALLEEESEADEDTDPVTLLWRTFRRGYPLMLLYNSLNPEKPIEIPRGVKDEKKGKAATFKFLQACITVLKFPAEECFIVTDLYGDDTTGFVKVARVVNRVLDILVARGLISDLRPANADLESDKGLKRTQRQFIVNELVSTERTYVQHLQLLQAFKRLVEERSVVSGDTVHDIFLNLNSLIDFQRRFLIRVEQTYDQPEEMQNWGLQFVMYKDAFVVYETYIANQRRCLRTVEAEFSRLKEAGGASDMRQICESPATLHGFLMKPFQRLSKYPLLLRDLLKKGDFDEQREEDLRAGLAAAEEIMARANLAVEREEKYEAVQELKTRVEDWKGHRVEGFGELLLYGTFTVVKSEAVERGKDGERQVGDILIRRSWEREKRKPRRRIHGSWPPLNERQAHDGRPRLVNSSDAMYHVYLFETILLCCKDIDPTKAKNKLANRQAVDKRGKPKLQLKGRIFMQNVTDLVSLSKQGSYTCQIFWKGDPSIENFIIRFKTEDDLKRWAQQIEAQRRRYRERARGSDGSRHGPSGTSQTEFEFMRNQTALVNPYMDQPEDDDDEELDTLIGSTGPPSTWSQQSTVYEHDGFPRHGSQSSLRSRSTTNDSMMSHQGVAGTRGAAPRFPPGSLNGPTPLTLRTQQLHDQTRSPVERSQESYFSPTGDSPQSNSRVSSTSNAGMYPFPRQPIPPTGYHEDGSQPPSRFTAPAMPRTTTTGPTASMSGSAVNYGPDGPPRPGMPRGMHSAQQLPPTARNRSASSSDIHISRRLQGEQPPMPNMPTSYQHPALVGGANRSQSNSPALSNGYPPPRGLANSPQAQRDRQYQRQGSESSPIEAPRYEGMSYNAAPRSREPYVSHSRTVTPVAAAPQEAASPPATAGTLDPRNLPPPTQLKVKVHAPAASQSLTLVVPLNISYQSLKDRIDAKLQRSTNLSLGDRAPKESQVKLKYLDEDDYVSIQSDEDVQTAFETWREQRGEQGGMGEIELFCQR